MWHSGKLEVVASGSLTGQDKRNQCFASLVDCNGRELPAVDAVVAAVVVVVVAAAAAEDAAAAATLAALHHNFSAFPARSLLPDCS